MKSRRALEIYSKGETVYEPGDSLLEQKDRFLGAFEAKEQRIAAQKAADSVPMPFLESIKRKVANLVDGPDTNLPVVARFDLYSGIRKLSERAPKDAGLSRLAKQLERSWHQDPLGTLSYGSVSTMVKQFKDTFPRSKAADAIQAECVRVGLHKLPVAKLARLAANIQSQEDFDTAMQVHGYSGNRPEQIRARTLVRELVALRGSDVDPHIAQESGSADMSVGDRVVQKISQLDQMAPPEMAGPPMPPPPEGDQEMDMGLMPEEPMEDDTSPGAAEEAVEMMQEIDQAADEIIQQAPPEAQDFIQHEEAEGWHTDLPGTATWGAEEVLLEGHEAPPPSEEWLLEELEEMGGAPDAGMPMDLPAPPSVQMETPDVEAAKQAEGEPGEDLSHLNKRPPLDAPRITSRPRSVGKNPAMGRPLHKEKQSVAPPGHEKQVLKLKKEDVDNPFAVAWSQHNKEEPGHKHKGEFEKAASSDKLLTKKIQDLISNFERGVLRVPEPEFRSALKKLVDDREKVRSVMKQADKGGEHDIPLPGKVKSQPNQDTPEQNKVHVPKDGGKALTAAEIEEAILTGNKVKVGSLSIHVNKRNEIEIWNKDAGQACDIMDMDTAIADFTALAKDISDRRVALNLNGEFNVNELISVPCENCAEVNVFMRAASNEDGYACDCGHVAENQFAEELAKLAAQYQDYQIEVSYRPAQDPQMAKQQRSKLLATLQRAGGQVQIHEDSRGYIMGTVSSTDEMQMASLKKQLMAMGAQPVERRVAQLGDLPPPGGPLQVSAPAAGPAAAPPPTSPDMPPHDIINAALTHYKSMGLATGPGEALAQMYKDYKEREDLKSPENQQLAWQLAGQLFGGGTGPAAPAAGAPPPAPGAPGSPPPGPMSPTASVTMKSAQEKMKVPSVRKPKDHVKVPADPGKDTEGETPFKQPSIPTTHPMSKNDGIKLPAKGLDKDSEPKDLPKSSPSVKVNHPPTKQPGVKLPPKGLDKDLQADEPFKVPKLKSEPSVKKN